MDKAKSWLIGYWVIEGLLYMFEFLSFIELFSDENVDIKAEEIPVNAVATALKQFFSDLREPLIPTSLHDELTEASGQSQILG